MKIRSLKLTNVRKFGGRSAEITGIGDGLSVVSEANEFGKSTFFDAVHALFFERHGSTAKPVKSLQPHAGGGVAVAAEVETPQGRFLIEKRFLAQKGASVRDIERGAVIARDGEAEDWISRLIGEAEQGPAGLLWVRQGMVGLEPADGSKTERENLTTARRDLMSSVAGEIDQVTGGRRMDRILARCQRDFDQIATAKGHKRGAWKEAADRADTLAGDLAGLTRQCEELSGALAERRRIDDELRRIDEPQAKAALDHGLKEAEARLQEAKAHADRIAGAEQALRIALLERDSAATALDTLTKAETALAGAVATLAACKTAGGQAATDLITANDDEARARKAVEDIDARLPALRLEVRAAERREATVRAKGEADRFKALLGKAREHQEALHAAEGRLQGNKATEKAVDMVEDAAAETARLDAALRARVGSLTLRYEGARRITLDGVEVPGDQRLQLGERAEIRVPGIGEMLLELPAGGDIDRLQAQFRAARERENAAIAACGAGTLAEARQLARERQAAANDRKLAAERLGITAPDGIEALQSALAAALAECVGEVEDGGRPGADILAEIAEAEAALSSARGTHERSRKALDTARDAAIRAEAALDVATREQDRAEAEVGPADTRTERRGVASTAAADAARAATEAQVALDAMTTAAPDLLTAEANHKRASAAVAVATTRRVALDKRRAELSVEIGVRADQNVEARRDEAIGELEALNARLALFEAEKAVLIRLREALESAREDAREAYFGPIQEELAPLIGILHDDAGIDWESATVMPGALRRGGAVEAFETLSGGTQEQIAILTRLAFARLFARRGQHLPIILDDALVYSDDDRIVKMFTALNRVAMEQQIIVFSCRQLAFASLGGERPRVAFRDWA